MKKNKSEFIVGKFYRRIPSDLAGNTALTDEMFGYKRIGEIKLNSIFLMLQIEGKQSSKKWYKVLTSDGVIGWAPLEFIYWEQVVSE
jgi:hypothetical protein